MLTHSILWLSFSSFLPISRSFRSAVYSPFLSTPVSFPSVSQNASSSFFTGHFPQFCTSDKLESSVLFRRGTYFPKVAIFCKSKRRRKTRCTGLPRENLSESRGSGLASVKIASYSRPESLFQYSLHRFFRSVCTGTSCKFTRVS